MKVANHTATKHMALRLPVDDVSTAERLRLQLDAQGNVKLAALLRMAVQRGLRALEVELASKRRPAAT